MRIGIDARLIGQTGVGRYIKNLLRELAVIDKANQYVIFLRQEEFASYETPNARWKKVLCDVPWHSITEQIQLPFVLLKHRLDLVHIPYFTIPLLYPKKFIVTMHDVTILHMKTGRATTHSRAYYEMRRLGYKIVLKLGLTRAIKIITVSETIKEELRSFFGIPEGKIIVTYEGVDTSILQRASGLRIASDKQAGKGVKQKGEPHASPYILYVGNAYPHKNVESIIDMISEFESTYRFVFVGKEDVFYKRLMQYAYKKGVHSRITCLTSVSDDRLAELYASAQALIFPSLFEGFGLPGLEAMAAGTPVVCSDIPVFHEIYGKAAVYFAPKDPRDMKKALERVLADASFRAVQIDRGHRQVEQYSWRTMAERTLGLYNRTV